MRDVGSEGGPPGWGDRDDGRCRDATGGGADGPGPTGIVPAPTTVVVGIPQGRFGAVPSALAT